MVILLNYNIYVWVYNCESATGRIYALQSTNKPYNQPLLDLHCPVYQKVGVPSTQQDRWDVRELRLIQVRCVKSGRNMTLSGGEKRIKEVE